MFDVHSLNQTKNYKNKMCVKMSAVLRQSHWISKLLVKKSHDPCLQEARGGTAVDMSAGAPRMSTSRHNLLPSDFELQI